MARRFGAGSMVHGSLVREGADVRLDFVLLPTDGSAAPLARASVSSAPDSIAALTDSAVHVLLRQIWTGGSAPDAQPRGGTQDPLGPGPARIPRRGATDRRRSGGTAPRRHTAAPGRRIRRSGWRMPASSMPGTGRSRRRSDTLVEALQRHRFELPESERLTTEASVLCAQDSVVLALDRARRLTERYPSSWFGWLDLRRRAAAQRPAAGTLAGRGPSRIPACPRAQSRPHPGARAPDDGGAPGSRHRRGRARACGELTRLGAGPSLTADGYGDRMLQFRFLDGDHAGRQRAHPGPGRQRRPGSRAGSGAGRKLLRCVSLSACRPNRSR